VNKELLLNKPNLHYRGSFFAFCRGDLPCVDGFLVLQSQQMTAREKQIGQAAQHEQAMCVLA
jgi:hypothetical protein